MDAERTNRLSASPQLFESRFLDFFSRVHPAIPALIFVPVVIIGVWLGLDGATTRSRSAAWSSRGS